nr:UvrD-like helicase, ATP-binding domain, P-loop containing nucleoside triphosphate hydrolase [Tanacetum cinerariifolium]
MLVGNKFYLDNINAVSVEELPVNSLTNSIRTISPPPCLNQPLSHRRSLSFIPINHRALLFMTCSVYGTVVDVFIPEKYPKQVRFDRPHRFNKASTPKTANDRISPRPSHSYVPQQYSGQVGFFANTVNGMSSDTPGSVKYPSPALVLDDTCLAQRGLAYHVMGKVKDFTSIPNLYMILKDEGFFDIKVSYLGGTWVLFELKNKDAKENFMKHTGIKSWLYEIQDARTDFVSEERIVWMDIEGIPLNVWTHNTFEKIGKK